MVDETRITRLVRALIHPLEGRIKGLVRRATLGFLSGGAVQKAQLTTTQGNTDDGVEYFEAFGFTSSAPAGSEGIVLRVSGSRAESVAICFGDRKVRFDMLASGEVAVYNSAETSLVLRVSGNIEITPGETGVVQLGGPTATLAVSRITDTTRLDTANITSINTMITAFNTLPIGTPLVSVGGIVPITGAGTITSGGDGATST